MAAFPDALALRLAAIVQSSEDAILSKDLNSIITSWNPAAERMFGYPADEIIGRPITLIIPPERLDEEEEVLSRVRTGVSVEHYETVRVRKDGTPIAVSLTVSPIRTPDGLVIGASNITRDISERRRTEAALAAAESRRLDLQRRLLALVSGSKDLVGSPEANQVLPAIVSLARSLIEADGYAIWRFNPIDERWHVGCAFGISDAFARGVVDAQNGQQVVPFHEALVAEDVNALPLLDARRSVYATEGIRSMMAAPLVVGGQGSGTLVFYYRRPHAFDEVEIQTASALGNLAAAALTTSRLYEDQRRSREEAERNTRQATLLAEIGATLATSLDYETTLRTVARLAVPAIADWCAVDIVDDDHQSLRRLAVAHVDPQKVALAQRLEEEYPADPAAAFGTHAVVRTGSAEMVPEITDDMIRRAARDARHYELLHSLSIVSYVCVPLVAHGRTAGAMTFVMAESGRRYTDADLRFAKEVAYRAAFAVENARAYRQANIANRAKDEFLATLSHELRTPLNAVLGWTRMLRVGAVSDARVPRALAVIEQNAEAQLRLVEDMLDLSRIIKGTFRLDTKPMSLSAAIDAAIETVRPAAAARRIALTVDADPDADRVRGDAARLQQAIWNLLSNAIKFTPSGGRVSVGVHRAGPLIQVEVSDTGEGIEGDVLPFIFDRFRQGDSGMNRAHMGLGLGLAIVRHIMEMHGGRAEVKSEGKGKGATFTLSVPALDHERGETGAAAAAAVGAHDTALSGISVLLVEDDADAREMLAELLSTRGIRVVVTANVQDGLAAFEREALDVVLSDLAMPGEDGFDLIRQIRRHPRGGELPAIAISAYARAEDRSRSLASGFQRHLAKPVNPADLFGALSELTAPLRTHFSPERAGPTPTP